MTNSRVPLQPFPLGHKIPPLKTALYQMALHRPVELAAQTGQVESTKTTLSGNPTYQAVSTCLDAARGVNGALFKRR